jgi:prepilin peptidase CpaA
MSPLNLVLAPLRLSAVVTALAAWTDWRTGLIPNWLTFGAAALGLAVRVLTWLVALDLSQALVALLVALAGAALCSVIPALLFWKGGIGGGDVKLFAALGIICSPELGLLAQSYAFIVALLLAPAWLLYHGTLLKTLKQTFSLVSSPFRRKREGQQVAPEDLAWFRLGPAIFLGTLLAVSRALLLT